METFLGAFDFDYTIIKENSDFVVRDLVLPEVIRERLESNSSFQGWTSYMQEIFQILFEKGITEEKIKETVASIPAVPDCVSLFKTLNERNCEIIIISDSNTYFIEEWLKKNEIRETVHAIYSNPAYFSGGQLHIQKYHEQNWCKLSTKNLCKGYILQKHIENRISEGANYKKVFYVGDGHNDLCPSLKLSANDIVFPRIGFPLVQELRAHKREVKANIVPWEHTNQILSGLTEE